MTSKELEESARKVFEENMRRFEGDAMKSLADPKDREALAELMSEWRRLGHGTLLKLSQNQPWNMPLYFALSAAILNRRKIKELQIADAQLQGEVKSSFSTTPNGDISA